MTTPPHRTLKTIHLYGRDIRVHDIWQGHVVMSIGDPHTMAFCYQLGQP